MWYSLSTSHSSSRLIPFRYIVTTILCITDHVRPIGYRHISSVLTLQDPELGFVLSQLLKWVSRSFDPEVSDHVLKLVMLLQDLRYLILEGAEGLEVLYQITREINISIWAAASQVSYLLCAWSNPLSDGYSVSKFSQWSETYILIHILFLSILMLRNARPRATTRSAVWRGTRLSETRARILSRKFCFCGAEFVDWRLFGLLSDHWMR